MTLLLGQMTETVLLVPAPDDVASLLRARTRDDNGVEVGVFNARTRPTEEEVRDYIGSVSSEVLAQLPEVVPTRFEALTKRVMALRAAMQVEVSYDPDRSGSGGAFDSLSAMYDQALAALLKALDDADQGSSSLKPRGGALRIGSMTTAVLPPRDWPDC